MPKPTRLLPHYFSGPLLLFPRGLPPSGHQVGDEAGPLSSGPVGSHQLIPSDYLGNSKQKRGKDFTSCLSSPSCNPHKMRNIFKNKRGMCVRVNLYMGALWKCSVKSQRVSKYFVSTCTGTYFVKEEHIRCSVAFKILH